jgi:hypothetical protein
MKYPSPISIITFAITFCITVLVSSTYVIAQVETVQTKDFTGKIVKVENRTFFVKSGNDTREVTIPDNVSITRNGQTIEMREVQVDDDVKVTTDQSDAVLAFDVTSQAMKRAVPLAVIVGLLGLVAAVIGLMFWKKTHTAQIQTN